MKKILALFILLAIFKTTIAQTNDTTKYNPKTYGYGWTYNRMKFDSGLIIPRIGDTTSKTKGQVRILGNSLCWVGNDGTWYVAGSGGNTYTAGYGLNLTSFAFRVDTNLITTRAWHNKGMDSLGAIIATKENSLTFANGLVRTVNTIKVDTGRTSIAIATGGALLKVADSLGIVKFSSVGGSLTGTGGAGHVGFAFQTSDPSIPASGYKLYANSAGLPTWRTSTGTIVTVAGLENTQTFSGAKTFQENTYKIEAFSGYATATWDAKSANYNNTTSYYTFNGFAAPTSGTKIWHDVVGWSQSNSSSANHTLIKYTMKNPNSSVYAQGTMKTMELNLLSQSGANITDGRVLDLIVEDNVTGIGTFTNSYGLYLSQNTTSGTKYGIFQTGTATGVLNYLGGSLTVKTITDGTAGTDSLLVESGGALKKISPTYYGTSAGSGLTSLNGLTASTQTFAKVDDTNVTLGIGSATSTHTFTLGWTGTLADSRIASAATWNAKQAALSGTGIVKSTAGTISYLTDNTSNWDAAYTARIGTFTTTGSSGAATFSANTLNIPNYTLTGLGGIANGGGAVSYTVGLISARPAAGTAGRFYVGTDTGLTYYDTGSAWVIVVGAFTGDVTKPVLSMATVVDGLKGSAIPTLAAGNLKYNGSAWTFDNATYLTANQNVTVTATGDATGTSSSSPTAPSIALTLATVNSNVGSFGSATASPTYTVNAKGLITAAADVTITPAVGSLTGLGTGVATALAVNTGTAGSFVVNGGALGTPSSGTLTNATGLPESGIVRYTKTHYGTSFATSNTIALSTTNYIAIQASGSANATENNRLWVVPETGTLRNLYVGISSTQSATGSLVFTIRQGTVGGMSDTGFTLTIPAGSTAGVYSNTGSTLSVTAGDVLSYKVVNNATATSAPIVVTAIILTN